MAKNNCKQCEENSKWRILGTDCSQAIFDTLESCENYKEGYGQSTEEDEMSNFDLLFKKGGTNSIDIPDYGDDDYIIEGEGNEDSDVEDEVYYIKYDKNGNWIDGDVVGQGNTSTEDDDDEINEDDKCRGIDCGENGECVNGNCQCDEGYDNSIPGDWTSPCVKKPPTPIDPDNSTITSFELPGDYDLPGNSNEVKANQAKSIWALTMSFNPRQNKNSDQIIFNEDLPLWECGQVQPGGMDEDQKRKAAFNKAKVNPILHEIFCGGDSNSGYLATTIDYGGGPWSSKTTKYNHAGGDGSACFPKKGIHIRSGRYGHCVVHNNYGSGTKANGTAGYWLFCAFGIVYVVDLFVMKYWDQISKGDMPGGQGRWRGSTGAASMVRKNAKNNTDVIIGQYPSKTTSPNANIYMYDYVGGKAGHCMPFECKKDGKWEGMGAGPMKNSANNIAILEKMSKWKGALFCHGGHIGIVTAIIGKSHPPTATFWTLEYNVNACVMMKRQSFCPALHTGNSKARWLRFVDTTDLLGGSWAPKGLGNRKWLEDFFDLDAARVAKMHTEPNYDVIKDFEKYCTHGSNWDTLDPYAKIYNKDFKLK